MSRLLVRLVILYPSAFRRRFGAEMEEQIRSEHRRARSSGRLPACIHSVAQAADLVGGALAEHWRPTWTGSSRPHRGSPPMSTRPATWLSGLRQDLRHAVRSLRRSPGFVAVTVATLGLALGVSAGTFSVVDTVLLDPLPYRDADRLVTVEGAAPGSDLPPTFGLSMEFFLHYREHSERLESVALYNRFTNTLRADDRAERVWMSTPTSSLFEVLGVSPLLGRLPTPEDESRVAVISHALWTTWFGSDPEVVGRTLYAGGRERTVIAVMGRDFWFPSDEVLLWIPAEPGAEISQPWRFGLPVVARAAPGVSREEAAAELGRLARQVVDRYAAPPSVAAMVEQHRAVLTPIDEALIGSAARPLWVLLGAVTIVLLIACANVANLFQVRSERRHRDLAVQRAIGARRGRLVQSQMVEALVVAGLAGVVAVALAAAIVPLFVSLAPSQVPRLGRASVDLSTLLFAGGASFVSALLCGLVPAVRASSPRRTRLGDAARGSTRRRPWGRTALVVAQTALTLVLLIGSALLLRSYWHLRAVDPGYDVGDLFSFQIAPERADLTDAAAHVRFYHDFMERLAALPGVERVGLIENLPLDEGLSSARFQTDGVEQDVDSLTRTSFTFTAGAYFEAMGIELVAGRRFVEDDHFDDTGSVIVNETLAALFWPNEDPVGRRLKATESERWRTVVGVVEDVMQYSFRDTPEPMLYLPAHGMASTPAYVLKTERAGTIAADVRDLVQQIAPGAPMYRVYTMEELAADSMVHLSFTMLTLGVASTLALILGALGLYGVLSYVVAQRIQEIGVRMALGAAPSSVRRMVLAQGSLVVAAGIALGVVAALASTRVLASLLYGVEAVDLPTFVGMAAATAVLGLLATDLPARRASAVDPIRSLREG